MGNKCVLSKCHKTEDYIEDSWPERREDSVIGRFLPESLADRIIALLNEAVKPENCEAELFSCGLLNEARAILAEMTGGK